MRAPRWWVRAVSVLVPPDERDEWVEEWNGELIASAHSMRHAWGALADAWYLNTEGWTMDGMTRDVRTAVRSLIRRPAFTIVGGLTLALGIGANTAIFSVVDGVLLDPLPFPDGERVVSYNHQAPGLAVNVPLIPHSEAMYLHYMENAREVESVAVFSEGDLNLLTDGDPQQLTGLRVTQPYFDVIGVQPYLGRAFTPGEDRPGAEPVVVLGYAVWQQSFGGDRSVIGRLLPMSGVQRRVVGVMPEGFATAEEELWIPLVIDPDDAESGSMGLIGVARLADGATIESADAEMEQLMIRYVEQGDVDGITSGILEQAGLTADVQPIRDLYVQDVRDALWVLLGTVGFVLLIACANVANLFLVRAEARHREHAVRTAMGASRLDMVRQHLSESVILALGGGLVGLALASVGVRGLLRLAPADLPGSLSVGIDGSVLVFTLAVSLTTGLLFGLFPVLGYEKGDVSRALRDGGRASTEGRERHRARSGLVVAQVALALMLLVGSGLMLRSFTALRSVDLGFEPTDRLTFSYALPDAEYAQGEPVLSFQRRLTDELEAIPGVTAVGMISGLPLGGSKSAGPMEPVDQPIAEGDLAPLVERRQVTPGYFEAMSIEIVEGRGLEWGDQGDGYRAAVVSETLASAFWPSGNAVGRFIRNQGNEDSWEVVGIARDVRFDGVQDAPIPLAYLPVVGGTAELPGTPYGMDVVVAVTRDPLNTVPSARDALRAVDPRLPMINPRSLESVVEDSLAATSFTVLLLGIAAGIALLLGTVGIYGVVSYIVSRRTPEIGVRMALGAPAGAVLRDVVGQGMVLTGVGVLVGLAGAWAMSRVLESLLYGVSATDPLTFLGTAALLSAVALLATWIPARRASRIDPVEALRSE